MEKQPAIKEQLGKCLYVLDCVILVAAIALAAGVLVRTFQLETVSIARIRLHKYLCCGFLSFFLLFLIPRVRSNTRWFMKFTHESTHLVFSVLFFRKIHRFKVDEKDSHVSFSSGWFGYIPITLSPYCIPLFTLILLPWRFTTGQWFFLAVIDILIGFTYAFHVCCWVKQIRLHQTDISGPGVVRSILFISLFIIIGFCLIIQTPSSGVQLALQRVFWDYPREVITMF